MSESVRKWRCRLFGHNYEQFQPAVKDVFFGIHWTTTTHKCVRCGDVSTLASSETLTGRYEVPNE